MSRQYVTYIKEQYNYVKESRNVLFEYCKTVSPEHFINQNTTFGRGGSMRNLLVHIANTYEYWIANLALGKAPKYTEYEDNLTVQDVILLFDTVDLFMEEFIQEMNLSDREIIYEIQDNKNSASPLKFFSHVITHEYHHKGQILSLSRHLGYVPVDTDIMR